MAVVKLFGAFQDVAGWSQREIAADDLVALKASVAAQTPALAERLDHPSTLVIIDGVLLSPTERRSDRPLAQKCEVAFAPPLSGG